MPGNCTDIHGNATDANGYEAVMRTKRVQAVRSMTTMTLALVKCVVNAVVEDSVIHFKHQLIRTLKLSFM